jgi:hypothetical protein
MCVTRSGGTTHATLKMSEALDLPYVRDRTNIGHRLRVDIYLAASCASFSFTSIRVQYLGMSVCYYGEYVRRKVYSHLPSEALKHLEVDMEHRLRSIDTRYSMVRQLAVAQSRINVHLHTRTVRPTTGRCHLAQPYMRSSPHVPATRTHVVKLASTLNNDHRCQPPSLSRRSISQNA